MKTKTAFERKYYSKTSEQKKKLKQYYVNLFYNLFFNQFRWTGLNKEQIDFVMRKFWSDGTVACYRLPNTEEIESEDVLIFTPYSPTMFNIYDYPTEVLLTPSRGATFIPRNNLKVNENVVIGWIQRNKKGIYSCIENLIDKIVDIEMTLRTNLIAHKTPFLIGVTPESQAKMKEYFDYIDADKPYLFVDLEDIDRAKTLVSGAPYICQNLYQLKLAYVNEILTYFGIDNVGGIEKKEHLNADEVNSNNDIINDSTNGFMYLLREFCKEIKEVLGYEISVEPTSVAVNRIKSYNSDMEDDQDVINE